jgi:hypothetical protein
MKTDMNVLLSDNELEVCSKKAAIGRGFDFAHAERLGRWIVTLVHTPLVKGSVANLLLATLNQHHIQPGSFTPALSDAPPADGAEICTLLCANSSLAQYTAAIDLLMIEPERPVQLSAMSYPLLLLAEILIRADYQGGNFVIRIPEGNLNLQIESQMKSNEISISFSLPLAETKLVLSQPCYSVIVEISSLDKNLTHQETVNFYHATALGKKNHIDQAIWSRVVDSIKLTMVPESDESRIAGAGAGLTDND